MDWIVCAGLVLLIAAAYVQVVRFDFTNYDDQIYVPDNVQVRAGFSWSGIGWAFTTFETANWYPLTWLSLMLDCQLFGAWPPGHHLVNVVLHAANALLLFLLLKQMTAARWRSAIVAALFALHPLHVESVAWIAERKDVLSTFLFLLTLLAYTRFAARRSLARWILVPICMAFGLMCKPMLVTLPAVLVLLDYWPLGPRFRVQGLEASATNSPLSSFGRGAVREGGIRASWAWPILEKLPLFALSLAACAVTVVAQRSQGAMEMVHDGAGLTLRLANATIAYVDYLRMTLWPADLAVYYPYQFHPATAHIAVASVLLLVSTVAAIAFARRMPYLPVGWFWYLGTLVPVVGVVQVGSQAMADRYTYIPTIGIFIVVTWAAAECFKHSPIAVRITTQIAGKFQKQEVFGGRQTESGCHFHSRAALALIVAGILCGCLIITHGQLTYWANSERLFRHALAVTGDNSVSCENLGDALLHQKRYSEAAVEFRKVLAFDAKHYTQTPVELADALEGLGHRDEAVACLQEATRINPDNAEAIAKMAILGRIGEAIQLLDAAIVQQPGEARFLQRLAWIYATCPDHRFRNGPKAVEFAERACELTDRKNVHCLQTLADAYREAKDPTRAAEALRAARRLDHGDAAAD